VTDDRLNMRGTKTEGPPIGVIGEAGFGSTLLKRRQTRGQDRNCFFEDRVNCTMQWPHYLQLNLRVGSLHGQAFGFRVEC